MPHVDDGQLHAYLDGELRWLGEDPAALERHLEVCAGCRSRLEEARRLRELGRSLLGGQLSVERPPFEAVLLRARGGSSDAVRRRGPAAVWAATVVLALAGGWLARGLLPGEDPVPAGGEVRVASAPAPASARPAATAEATAADAERGSPAEVDADPGAPAEVEADRPSAAERIVEPGEPQNTEPQPLAASVSQAVEGSEAEPLGVPIPPAPQRVRSEPIAVAALPPVQRVESEPLAVQVSSLSDEGGRIEGTVTDESGRVIQGAVVQVRELGVGTLTGPDGSYSLSMPEESAKMEDGLVITAAALGWESAVQRLSPPRGGAITRDFRLRPAQVALEGIVAVGYGTQRRAAGEAETVDETSGAGWASAEPEEIRRLLGRDAFRIAGLPVLETAIGRMDGIRTVRVRQELPGGAIATLLQWAEPRAGDPDSAVVAVTGQSPSRKSPDGTAAEATVWRRGLRIVARAPVTAESLARLLETLE